MGIQMSNQPNKFIGMVCIKCEEENSISRATWEGWGHMLELAEQHQKDTKHPCLVWTEDDI